MALPDQRAARSRSDSDQTKAVLPNAVIENESPDDSRTNTAQSSTSSNTSVGVDLIRQSSLNRILPILAMASPLSSRQRNSSPGLVTTTRHPPLQPDALAAVARDAWRRRFWQPEVWRQALQTLSILLRNTSLCLVCVWCITFCCSHGNIFASGTIAKQSSFEFLVGTAVSLHTLMYGILLIANVPVLLPLQFIRHPQGPAPRSNHRRIATIGFCAARLIRHTFANFAASLTTLIIILVLSYKAPKSFRQLNPEYYGSALCIHGFTTAGAIAVSRIFRDETVIGQQLSRHTSKLRRMNTSRWRGGIVYYWRMYARLFPMVLLGMCAGMYVRIASKYRVSGALGMLWYTLGSLAIKFVLKEIAKVVIVKQRIHDPRKIFIIVGLPTVLIDTQVRIMLQRVQSIRYTLWWTLGMAMLEIATRLTKVVWVKHQLERRERVAHTRKTTPSSNIVAMVGDTIYRHNHLASMSRRHSSAHSATTLLKRFGTLRDDSQVIQWKLQMLTFQIAESYASMAAEYIAIVCSTSVLYFYWNHPKYNLNEYESDAYDPDQSQGQTQSFQATTLVIQVFVEIVVDYVSCALEISNGIEFQEVQRYRVYLALLFLCIAAVNVHICVFVYRHVE